VKGFRSQGDNDFWRSLERCLRTSTRDENFLKFGPEMRSYVLLAYVKHIGTFFRMLSMRLRVVTACWPCANNLLPHAGQMVTNHTFFWNQSFAYAKRQCYNKYLPYAQHAVTIFSPMLSARSQFVNNLPYAQCWSHFVTVCWPCANNVVPYAWQIATIHIFFKINISLMLSANATLNSYPMLSMR